MSSSPNQLLAEQEIVEHTLDNGLRVNLVEDHRSPVVAVNLWYRVGSRHEVPGRTGLAHLFEHLMFQGSAHVDANEHFSVIESLGGRCNATTSQDRTNYFETVLASGLPTALWLEADRMGSLLDAVSQENLDNQRDVVRNERRETYDNQPYGTSWERLSAEVFPPGHQYHHLPIGSMQDLAEADLADVHAFFERHYAPGNAVLTITGDVQSQDALRLVEQYFGGIQGRPTPAPPPAQILTPRTSTSRIVVDDEAVPAPALYVAWPVPQDGDPRCHDAEIALEALVSGQSSRLHLGLVRRREIAQGTGGTMWRSVGGSSLAIATVRGVPGVEPDELADAVFAELAEVGRDGLRPEEVAKSAAGMEKMSAETTAELNGLADTISHGSALFDDPRHQFTSLAELVAREPGQVTDTLNTWLTPENASLLGYRPVSTGALR